MERATGFGADRLRKWRQRFGFPLMTSTADGKAAYSRLAVDQLLFIKRLLEAGFQPAQVVGLTTLELEKLILGLVQSVPVVGSDDVFQVVIDHFEGWGMAGFQVFLAERRAKGTLTDFVHDTTVPLLTRIGDAFMRNEIGVHHEHLYTACIERFLSAEILKLQPKNGFPTILFALPPQERHCVGLLMSEAVLADAGATTISVGADIDLSDLTQAAIACKADVVALSFSVYYPARDIVPVLRHFRGLLPIQNQIWAGGRGTAVMRKPPKGVRILSQLNAAVSALNGVPL